MARTLERLAKLDTCAVSDALDALSMPAALSDIHRLSGDGCLVGKVKTVLLVEGTPAPDAPKVHLGATAITQADSETVILVSHPGVDAGGWGGVLTNAARIAGVRGVVVDGPTRDVDEARGLQFPIFARRGTARTARGRVYEAATGVPVTIDGVRIEDGDYIIADGSGVAIIFASAIEDVLAKAEFIAAREAAMVAALKKNVSVTEVMGADYETMLEK